MAYFAKLDDKNVVTAVYAVKNEILMENGVEIEAKGIDFLTNLHGYSRWVQTSYNGNIRKQYAGIDYLYDPIADVFIAPQPYPSWSLDDNYDWQAPKQRPEGDCYWDESIGEWVNVEANA